MAKLFGIEPRDGVLIDYDHRRSGGGQLQRSRGEGAGWGRQGEVGSAEALPEAMQEQLLLDDLLYAMMGFAGRCAGVFLLEGLRIRETDKHGGCGYTEGKYVGESRGESCTRAMGYGKDARETPGAGDTARTGYIAHSCDKSQARIHSSESI